MAVWKDIFVKRKYGTVNITHETEKESELIRLEDNIDPEIFTKCPSCGEILINTDLIKSLNVCYKCDYHFRINSLERINMTFDEESVEFFDENISSVNPLGYPGYDKKLLELSRNLGIKEAVITGRGTVYGKLVCFGVMDWRFIMGSMGSAVGEKLCRMIERAIIDSLPVTIFSVSGGARMQEGMLSLSQMTKVSAALKRHSNQGLLFINVFTDPTTGGVTASFASLGDIIIAEPNATIGFAGKRVIEQTIRQKLPEKFQSSEFMLQHGLIDMIVNRKDMKYTLSHLLSIHMEVV